MPTGRDLAAHQAVIRVAAYGRATPRDGHAPEGFEYVPGSATVDGNKVTDAKNQVIGAGEPVVS